MELNRSHSETQVTLQNFDQNVMIEIFFIAILSSSLMVVMLLGFWECSSSGSNQTPVTFRPYIALLSYDYSQKLL